MMNLNNILLQNEECYTEKFCHTQCFLSEKVDNNPFLQRKNPFMSGLLNYKTKNIIL